MCGLLEFEFGGIKPFYFLHRVHRSVSRFQGARTAHMRGYQIEKSATKNFILLQPVPTVRGVVHSRSMRSRTIINLAVNQP